MIQARDFMGLAIELTMGLAMSLGLRARSADVVAESADRLSARQLTGFARQGLDARPIAFG